MIHLERNWGSRGDKDRVRELWSEKKWKLWKKGTERVFCHCGGRDERVAEGETVSSVEKKIGLFQREPKRYRA